MDYLTFSVAYTGLKAVSAVVQNFAKLKKLSDLPSEIQEDTFYLIHTVHSIKPALELAMLLHARHITAVHVSSPISLARKVLVECDAFIDSIGSIDGDSDDDASSLSDHHDDSDDSDFGGDEQWSNAQRARNRQEVIDYLSAPSQRDRLALLLRRLQLVLQALNLGLHSAAFIVPRHVTIHQLPFTFNVDAFQIALDLIRRMEMDRKFNTKKRREIWTSTGNLHLFIIPSTKQRRGKRIGAGTDRPILTRLCDTKCVLSLEPKTRKLDGKRVFAAFMTLHSMEQPVLSGDTEDGHSGRSDDEEQEERKEKEREKEEGLDRSRYRMELACFEFKRFRRFDPIYTKGVGEGEMLMDDENEDVRDRALCHQWTFQGQSYILEFESLDKFHLGNVEQPISCEVFEFMIALLVERSTFLESNSKTKCVVENPSVLDQFVSVQDMVKRTKKYLRFQRTKEALTTPDHSGISPRTRMRATQGGTVSTALKEQSRNEDISDLADSIDDKLTIK